MNKASPALKKVVPEREFNVGVGATVAVAVAAVLVALCCGISTGITFPKSSAV